MPLCYPYNFGDAYETHYSQDRTGILPPLFKAACRSKEAPLTGVTFTKQTWPADAPLSILTFSNTKPLVCSAARPNQYGMRWSSVGLLVSIAALGASAAPTDLVVKAKVTRREPGSHNETVALLHTPVAKHHHAHNSHMIAMEYLNETARELKSGPRIQPYLRYDLLLPVPKPVLEENLIEWEALQEQFGNANHAVHGKLMAAHCLLMIFAFFVALPICKWALLGYCVDRLGTILRAADTMRTTLHLRDSSSLVFWAASSEVFTASAHQICE